MGRYINLFVVFSVLVSYNGVCSFQVTRARSLSQDPGICAPTTAPAINLPTEYATCAQEVNAHKNATNPMMGKTTDEIIAYYGYTGEIHNVTTDDGYILTIHRITGSPVSPVATGKPSVYVHHGMGGRYIYRNLAFKLADAGYDVWLTNCRGTTYSLGHTSLNSSADVKYWDFSWHEMAMYDVPATMDLITSVSGNEKMLYVGYSMGTTVYFITLSEMPQYNSRIIAGFMLSPVAFNGHSNSILRLMSPFMGTGEQYLLNPILQGRIDQQYKIPALFNKTLGSFCAPTAMDCGVCDNVIFGSFGFDAPQANYTNLPYVLTKFPNIISVKTLVHYEQTMLACNFQQFDYGPVENCKRYNGSIIPPSYDISKVTAPTYFFHGDSDNLAVPEDVAITQSHMNPETVIENFRVDWTLFNHLDFQWAIDADTLCYNKVLSLMQQYMPTS